MTGPRARRKIEFYDHADAPALHETPVMSMPEVAPEAADLMMEWGLSPGHIVKVLYQSPGDDGMSLVWSWFGPGYILPRHSHSADCLYYVISGEAHLGNRTVGAGSGFFVPADAPYAYAAGPEGIQVLEFRTVSSFDMRITESMDRWRHIVDNVREHTATWQEAARDV